MWDGIVLSLYGMGTVFAALVSFALLVLLISKAFARTSGANDHQ
jgi:Na+-transporting methylmalonyl-CoA/oxaloacetate decarboxylase gamma subunit